MMRTITSTDDATSSRISRWYWLNLRIFKRIHLPVPVFLAQDDKPSGLLTCGRHAPSLDIEGLHDCKRNVWPNKVKFLDRVASRVVMKWTPRCVKPGD